MVDISKHSDAVHNIKLSEEYFTITDIDISKSNNLHLPSTICNDCLKKLLNAYNYRLKSIASEECLQNKLNLHLKETEQVAAIQESSCENEVLKTDEKVNIDVIEEFHDDDNDNTPIADTDSSSNNLSKTTFIKEFKIFAKEIQVDPLDVTDIELTEETNDFSSHESYDIKNEEDTCDNEDEKNDPIDDELTADEDHSKEDFEWNPEESSESNGKTDSQVRVDCPHCKKIYNKKSLRRHIDRVHADIVSDNKKLYECTICNKNFNHEFNLKDHIKSMHETKTEFICDTCGKSLKSRTSLQEHNKLHTDDRPYSCDICDRTFVTLYKMRRHRKDVHASRPREKKFACQQCDKVFMRNRSLNDHVMKIHDADINASGTAVIKKQRTVHECSLCHKVLPDSSKLKVHFRTHTGERPFKCDVCGAAFNLHSVLKIHSRIHTDERPYECKVCKKRFRQNTTLIDHVRNVHTGKTIKCPEPDCNRRFSRASFLIVHRREHTGERPYQCDQCPSQFKKRSEMTHHIEYAHNGVTFNCNLCSKKFSDKYKLKLHSMTHLAEKPFKCDFCLLQFTLRNKLKVHMKLRHNIEYTERLIEEDEDDLKIEEDTNFPLIN